MSEVAVDVSRAETLWAWLEEDPSKGLGVIATTIPFLGISLSLVARSRSTAEGFRNLAAEYAKVSGHRVILREYRYRGDHSEYPAA